MIRTTENNQHITMYIRLNFDYAEAFDFLQKRGYEVKSWLWKYEDESFPNGKTYHEKWTFTATKNGEEQSENNHFLSVLEREIKEAISGKQ